MARRLPGRIELSDTSVTTVAWCMAAYIAIVIGRLTEIIPGMNGLPLAKICIAAVLFVAMGNPKLLSRTPLWKVPEFRTTVFFFALVALSITFSIWPGQTLSLILGGALVALISFTLVLKTARTWGSCRVMLLGCVWAAASLSFITLTNYGGGRAGSLQGYDTNDLALVLVALLPLTIAFALMSRGMPRVIYFGVAAMSLATALLTQSRGGLLGLMTLGLGMALAPPTTAAPLVKNRLQVGKVVGRTLLLVLLALGTWSMLPAETKERLGTLFEPETDYNLNLHEEGRMAIWTRNLKHVAGRPIGFGAGSFQMVDVQAGGKFRAPHNTLVQVIVELGVLGFLLFLGVYWQTFRGLGKLIVKSFESPGGDDRIAGEQRAMARALRISLVSTLVCSFFLSMAYTAVTWLILALATAIATPSIEPAAVKPGRRA